MTTNEVAVERTIEQQQGNLLDEIMAQTRIG